MTPNVSFFLGGGGGGGGARGAETQEKPRQNRVNAKLLLPCSNYLLYFYIIILMLSTDHCNYFLVNFGAFQRFWKN